jgi:hypothetical protein
MPHEPTKSQLRRIRPFPLPPPIYARVRSLVSALSHDGINTWAAVQANADAHREVCSVAAEVAAYIAAVAIVTNTGAGGRALTRTGRLLKFATSGSYTPTDEFSPIAVASSLLNNVTEE